MKRIGLIGLICLFLASLGYGLETLLAQWGDAEGSPANFTNVASIIGSDRYNLALRSNGTVITWGPNAPDLGNLTDVVAISAFAVLRANGELFSWDPTNLFLTNVALLSSGCSSGPNPSKHNLVILSNGTVFAWGNNIAGQCDVPLNLNDAVSVSAGGDFSVALKSDGAVMAWGDNSLDQLNVPAGLNDVASIGVGRYHTLALRSNGTVVAWGYNSFGRTNIPPEATNVMAISAGAAHNMVLRSNGTLLVWGFCERGQCDIPNIDGIVQISAGTFHSLALYVPIAPVIRVQPTNRRVAEGSTVIFSVHALGAMPLSYQWYFNSNVIVGATNNVFTLTNALAANSGFYKVIVTNSFRSVTSAPAQLQIVRGLDITLAPTIILDGEIGSTNRIEYVDEIDPSETWRPLADVILTNRHQYYPDLSAIGQPRRFYRLVFNP